MKRKKVLQDFVDEEKKAGEASILRLESLNLAADDAAEGDNNISDLPKDAAKVFEIGDKDKMMTSTT